MKNDQQQPKVSVVITSYNYEDYIGEAIESVIAQTYQNWELVVVDDASTDGSVAIISRYVEQFPNKIKLIAQTENRGVGYVANLGIENTTGEYIANLGSDDRMLPQRLEKQVAYLLNHPEVAVVCSDVVVIGADGVAIEGETVFSKPITDLRMQLLEGNFINSPSVTHIKGIHKEMGDINPVLDYVQDFDHWLRILDLYEIARLPEKLTEYRVHGKNLSARESGKHAYAGAYETVITVLRAIERRSAQINRVALLDEEFVKEKLVLAGAARKAELIYLGDFNLSVSTVYFLLLDIFEKEAGNSEAKELLGEVYCTLGDLPRAEGKTPITIEEYQTSKAAGGGGRQKPYQAALAAQKQTGLPLTTVVRSILDNREKSVSTAQDKKNFIVNTARFVFEQVKKEVNEVERAVLSSERLELIHSALQLLTPHFLRELDDEVLTLKSEIISWKERHDYQRWIDNHALMEIDAQLHAERLSVWGSQPVFHLVMFLFDGEGALLANTIDSLSRQFYGNWKLSVIADGEAPDPMFEELDVLEWISFPSGAEPYPFVNQFVDDSPADWIAFIPAGTQFVPQALLVFGDYINQHPEQRLFYSDDDRISETGERHSPRFKPDFNLDLLRSSDYIGAVMCQKALWTEADGIGIYPGYENMGLAFSAYEQIGQVGIGHISDVLVHLPESTSEKQNQAILQQVVTDHLARADCDALVSQGLLTGTIRVQYQHSSTPLVSIIIPTKDKLEFLHPCVESLLSKTGYSNYEVIIVDNQSSDPDVLIYLSELPESSEGKVRVIKYPHPFNYAAISNCAAKEANGEYLLFLNNDTEILHSEWLERMMSHAQRGDVGIVGARLVYPETGLLQHAGIIMGVGQIASHSYMHKLHFSEKGYMSRAQVDQAFSAVTGACLLINRQLYNSVSGMDEENLAVLYNDIDLCLKVNKVGKRVVWTPYATLLHHSNISLYDGDLHNEPGWEERAKYERGYMLRNWLSEISDDFAYNRNFSLAFSDYRIEHQMPCNWDVNFHDRTRVMGFPLPGGSGDYRVIDPFNALSQAGIAQCESYRFSHGSVRNIATFSEIARMSPDAVVFHASLSNVMLQLIEDVEIFLPDVCKIFTLDDLLTDMPEESSAYKNIQRSLKDAKPRIRRALAHCDRLIVTTEPLAELCRDMIDDIRVIPNRLRRDPWCNLLSLRQQSDKPRVGWAGAQQHQGDLKIIVDVVKQTAEEIDWVFMGMCPDELKPFVKENHDYVSIKEYPAKLASLNLDLAIAPLEQHPFNESKSNLRLLEYGILGWPVICTDIYPYSSYDAPVVRVNNNKDEWLEAIRAALKSPESLQQAGDLMRQWVLDGFILEDHLDGWKEALTSFSPGKQRSVLLKH